MPAKKSKKRAPEDAVATPAAKRKSAPSPAKASAADVSGEESAHETELAKLGSVNAPLWKAFQSKVDAIKCHPLMENIALAPPPAITSDAASDSGMQAAFDAQEFAVAMARRNAYKCAQNFFRHDLLFTATPSVPYRQNGIRELKKHHFGKGPAPFPMDLECAIGAGKDPLKDNCDVKRISPEEIEFAFVDAIHDDVEKNNEENIKLWRYYLTTVSYHYKQIDVDEDIAWAANQFRQDLAQEYASLHHTVYQKMMAIIYFIKKREKTHGKMTTPQVLKLYREKLTSAAADQLSDGFIDTAVTFYERVTSIPSLADLFRIADDKPNTPFDGWTKIQTIIGKGGSADGICWLFFGIWDMHERGEIPDGISLRAMQGKLPQSGGKGPLDLLLYKKGLLNHLLRDWARDVSKHWSKSVMELIEKNTSTHHQYRAAVGFPSLNKGACMQWKFGWPDSADEFFMLVESIVYSNDHDIILKSHCKNRKTFADACDSAGIAELLDDIKLKCEDERTRLSAAPTEKSDSAPAESARSSGTKKDDGSESEVEDVDAHMAIALPAQVADGTHAKVNRYRMHARRLIQSHVQLEVDPPSEAVMTQIITKSVAGSIRGLRSEDSSGKQMHKSLVHITYDVKVAGRSSSQAHLRVPPLRNNGAHLTKCIGACIKSRGDSDNLDPGDCYVIFDGMKHGNEQPLVHHPFKTLAGDAIVKHVRKLSILYSEKSLKERSGRVRGYMPISQLEHCYVITGHALRMESKDHCHFDGTNQGLVLGYVTAAKWSDAKSHLRATPKGVKGIFGKTGIISVGGAVPSSEDTGAALPAGEDGEEPVFPHSQPPELDEEIGHSYFAAAHVDLTVGPGHRAFYACTKKVPYLGFCITDAHKAAVMRWLETRIFDSMQSEGAPLYQPALAELIATGGKEEGDSDGGADEEGEEEEDPNEDVEEDDEDEEKDEEGDDEDEDAGKKKPKNEAKAKGKAKGKATKATLMAKLAVLQTGAKKKAKKGTASKAQKGTGKKDESEPDSPER